MASFSHRDYTSNPFLATPAIGQFLRTGCLNLFLGAGVSKGFGLPEWTLLVARILGKGGDAAYVGGLSKLSDKELAKLVDPMDTDEGRSDLLKLVHKALYEGVEERLLDQLAKSPLLLAVAALLTGTCRGRVERVFTYNFDNLLEQYLEMLGLAICMRTDPFQLSTKADVEINHVHGFLPQLWDGNEISTQLVLSERSYRNRRSEIDEGWSACVEHSLYSRAALFIGLSGNDSAILDVLQRAKKRITRSTDYHGFWLLAPEAYERNHAAILDVGMCPIRIMNEELPKFVFEVCQAASATTYAAP